MKRFFLSIWISVVCFQLQAQTTRPAVLVIGNGNAAAAAAIQAAVSGVKTTVLLQAGGFDINPIANDLNSGLQADFFKKINIAKGIKDSLIISSFDKKLANEVLTKWTDSLKNLTVIKNVIWTKADRSGNNWTFKLSDGKTLKPSVLIVAGDGKLKAALEIKTLPVTYEEPLNYANTVYRTSVSSGKFSNGSVASILSMYNLFVPDQENLIWLKGDEGMLIGQAAGAAAAYAGFFGTKLSEIKLKETQGELINYRLAIMPFSDIQQQDSNWKAIQFVGVSGVIKGRIDKNGLQFMPDKFVTTEEIKQPFKDLYYKAQIWFDDYESADLTLAAAIDMICYVGQKAPETTIKEIEKNWKTVYKLASTFDLKKRITRREFAVILKDYMSPFNVNVDKNGKVLR
ncbi:hypothetical protein WG904_05335 [Pedobacter sp. Du54]|uniref:hypothetical protein n=1 Tax=Pedobacter anseongensis TaxID=3133439 RepID=UPI0030A03E86